MFAEITSPKSRINHCHHTLFNVLLILTITSIKFICQRKKYAIMHASLLDYSSNSFIISLWCIRLVYNRVMQLSFIMIRCEIFIGESNPVPMLSVKDFLISFAKDVPLHPPGVLIQASAEFYWMRQLIRCLRAHRYVRSERATTLWARHILHMYNASEQLNRAHKNIGKSASYNHIICLVLNLRVLAKRGTTSHKSILSRAYLLNTIDTRELVTYISLRVRHISILSGTC